MTRENEVNIMQTKTILLSCALVGFSLQMWGDITAEQLGVAKFKILSLINASTELTALIAKVESTGSRNELSSLMAELMRRLQAEKNKLSLEYLPSHEDMSGFKTAFYGLRFNSCKRIYDEASKKRDEISSLRVATKHNFDKEQERFLTLCDNEGKMLGNQDISTNAEQVIANIKEMLQVYNYMIKCVEDHCIRSN